MTREEFEQLLFDKGYELDEAQQFPRENASNILVMLVDAIVNEAT